MPRMARKFSNTKVYHIIFRGNDKQDIFFDQNDYKKFLKELTKAKEKYKFDLYAYCLMTNHIHLVVYDKNENLSKAMQSLILTYSIYFGKKHEKVGHLMQERFLSKNVETKEYLIRLCRYIHLNPVKAKIAKLNTYKWSSYNEYVKVAKIIDTKMVLKILGETSQEVIEKFIEIHKLDKENINDYAEFEIINKLNDDEAKERIQKLLNLNNVREIREYNNELRNKKIKELKVIKGISKTQLSRILGINRKIIERAMK